MRVVMKITLLLAATCLLFRYCIDIWRLLYEFGYKSGSSSWDLVNSREAPPLAKNESLSTMATGSILNDHRRIIDIFNPPTKETIKAILLEESKLLGVSTTNSSTSSSSSNHQATNTTTDSSKQKQKEDILDQTWSDFWGSKIPNLTKVVASQGNGLFHLEKGLNTSQWPSLCMFGTLFGHFCAYWASVAVKRPDFYFC